jgi:hypothetical protein
MAILTMKSKVQSPKFKGISNVKKGTGDPDMMIFLPLIFDHFWISFELGTLPFELSGGLCSVN